MTVRLSASCAEVTKKGTWGFNLAHDGLLLTPLESRFKKDGEFVIGGRHWIDQEHVRIKQ